MNKLQTYVAEHASVKPNSEIASRWHSRVVANSLHIAGRRGAESYLAQYAKGAKEPKLIQLARMAEVSEAAEFAKRVWEEAFFLSSGQRETFGGGASLNSTASPAPSMAPKAAFGTRPQLLVVLPRHTAFSLIENDDFCLQEKHDGERMLTRVKDSQVEGGNKKGLARTVPHCIEQDLAIMPDVELDGELVGTTYWVFDLLSHGGADLRSASYADRYARLAKLIPANSDSVKLVRSATGSQAKRALSAELEARNAEGFVLKKLNAPYESGESHGAQWKFQFRVSITVVAGKQNGSKSSVQMLVKNADGTERDLGNVTIPQNQRIPAPGEFMEVQYLYCFGGVDGKLAQPVFLGIRSDAEPSDCLASKLKLKAA